MLYVELYIAYGTVYWLILCLWISLFIDKLYGVDILRLPNYSIMQIQPVHAIF